jgi:hypothetical protein
MHRRCFLSLAALIVAGSFVSQAQAESIVISGYSYAAIAFSKSTGKHGFAYNYRSRYAAEQAAKKNCGEKDAEIACWVNRGFCALALGDDKSTYGSGWTFGDGAGNITAMNHARTQCNQRTKNARVVLCISSDGQYIRRAR